MCAAGELDFVWVDVACIDQENRAIKKSEVGRQAAIFQQADHVFVWLNSCAINEFQIFADGLQQCADILEEEDLERHDMLDEFKVIPEDLQILPCFRDHRWVSSVKRGLERLLEDP